jgi:RHS repeat-associated protein
MFYYYTPLWAESEKPAETMRTYKDYNARYYDPALGLFLSPDTIVPDAGQIIDYHRYGYVRNSPLKYTDPTGHEPNFDGGGSCAMPGMCWSTHGWMNSQRVHPTLRQSISSQSQSPLHDLFSQEQWTELTDIAKQAAQTQLIFTEDGQIDWQAMLDAGAQDLLSSCGKLVEGLCGLSFGGAGAVFAVGLTGSFDLVADSKGSAALFGTAGGGGYAVFSGVSGRGYGGALMFATNATIDDMRGTAVQFGGSAYQATTGVAVEWITGRNVQGTVWHGAIISGPMNAQLGWGSEVHGTVTYSWKLEDFFRE